jgi:F0F1-type ATP synthase membrane subunit c/vacuolar-type H+-ATPase subunit K
VARIPQATLQQQFKTTNYIGLALMAAVFIYATIVMAIDKGFIPYKTQQGININTVSSLRYILLAVSILNYFVIRFFQRYSLKAANYLPPGAIITFALCETVAVFGLVLFLLSGNSTDFFLFMVISLLYFYLFYPKYAEWEKVWRQPAPPKPAGDRPGKPG